MRSSSDARHRTPATLSNNPGYLAFDGQRRRPQTGAVSLMLGFGAFVLLFFVFSRSLLYSCCFTALCAYAPFFLDRSEHDPDNTRLSRRLQCHPIFSYLASLYLTPQLRLHDDCHAVSQQQIILAVTPHGIATGSHFALMTDLMGVLTRVFPHPRRDLAASVLFFLPLMRDLLLALGCVDAGKSTCHKVLSRGYSCQLYVGGEREQLLTDDRVPCAYVSGRKGIIAMALQYKVPIIPCYVFNEDRLYKVSKFLLTARLALAKNTGIAIPLCYGRFFSFIPFDLPLIICCGKPVVPQSDDTVDTLHERYCRHLLEVFDENKKSVKGYEQSTLRLL